MFDTKVFWIAFSTLLCLGLLFPVAVMITLRESRDDALRWIKNSTTFTFFMGFIFPASVAVFFATADLSPFIGLTGRQAWIAYGSFPFFLLLGLFPVHETVKRKALDPFMYRDHNRLLSYERDLRGRVKKKRRVLRCVASGSADERAEAIKAVETERRFGLKNYSSMLPSVEGTEDYRQHGSIVSWVVYGLNATAGVFFAVVFWFLFNHVVLGTSFKNVWLDPIFVVIGLMALWFPLRLYSEWYVNFYSLEDMREYYAFWMILIAAFVSYLFVIFQNTENVGTRVFSVAGTGLLGIISVLGKVRPDWVGYVADVMDDMPFRWFSVMMLVILVGLSAMIIGLFGG